MKFRHRNSITTFFILFVSSLLVVLIIYSTLKENAIRYETRRIREYGKQTLMEVDTIINNGARILKLMSTSPRLNKPNVNLRLMRNRLTNFNNLNSIFLSLSYYDRTGICREDSSGFDRKDKFPYSDKLWQKLRGGRSTVAEEIVRDPSTSINVVLILYPLIDAQGHFNGILMGKIPVRRLLLRALPQMLNSNFQEDFRIALVDKHMKVIASNHPDFPVFKTINYVYHNFLSKHSSELNYSTFRYKKNLYIKEDQSHYLHELGLDWKILIGLNEEFALGQARKIRNQIALVFLIVILLLTIFYFLNGYLISRPIEELYQGIQSVLKGNFNNSLIIKRDDEIGGLASAYNKLVGNLRSLEEEKKNAEKETKTALEIVEHSPYVLVIRSLDDKFSLEFISNNAEKLGWKALFMIDSSYLDKVHPEDRKRVRDFIDDKFKGREFVFDLEYRIIDDSAKVRWFHDWITIQKDPVKRGYKLLGILTDISDRILIQDTLKKSKDQFQQLAENIDVVFWIRDPNIQEISYVNPAYEKVFEQSRESLYEDYTKFLKDVHEDDLPHVLESYRNNSKYGNFNMEYRLRFSDGRIKWIWARTKPIFDAEGDIIKLFGIAEDITVQKIHEKKILDAKIEAEQATLAKNQFLTRMSHEIRTPLNAIMGMTELALATDDAMENRDYLHTVFDSSQHLLSVINDLLDISKIEANKVELRYDFFNLREILQSIVDTYSVKDKNSTVKIHLSVQPTVPEVLYGDALKLRQILTNFVSNAVKFTNAGKIELGVYEERNRQIVPKYPQNARTIVFYVQDTGSGIEAEKLKYLFHSSTHVGTDFTRRFKGSGLGLVICYELAKIMRGKIWAESEKGKGSKFYVAIPFERKAYDPAKSLDAKRNKTDADVKKYQAKRTSLQILIAEDNPVNLKLGSIVLEKLGHHVDGAENGQVAVQKCQEKSYDIVFMDLEMPEMDGLTATKEIRKIEQDGSQEPIPIIAMSAHVLQTHKESCIEAGMDDFIAKPFELGSLEQIVKKYQPKEHN